MSENAASTGRAVRLIFEYDGDTVRLISQQPVDMAVPAGQPEPQAGYVVETRDPAGGRLARVAVHGGFVQSAEVFPEDHAEPITRVDTPARGAFTVVVPAQTDATQVAVVRVAPRVGRPPGDPSVSPAPGQPEDVELASFALEQPR